MKFHNAVANCGCMCRFEVGSAVLNYKNVSVKKEKKDTSALEMSHWKHIGYIYQSRKHYRVNNISI